MRKEAIVTFNMGVRLFERKIMARGTKGLRKNVKGERSEGCYYGKPRDKTGEQSADGGEP